MLMKHQVVRLLLSVLTGTLPIISVAQKPCTNATLSGNYAFRISGELFTPAGIVYRDGVAMAHFDGMHTLTQVDYVLANGVPVPGPADPYGFHNHESGSYSVNPDCTGAAVIHFSIPPGGTSGAVIQLAFVVADHGRELHTIVTSVIPPNSTVPVPANIHSDATKVSGDDD